MGKLASSSKPPPDTVLKDRHEARREARRRAYERLFLVGTVAWPFFFLHDLASALTSGHERALPWMGALRVAGVCVALPCMFLVRAKRASLRSIAAMDYLLFTLGGALLGWMALAVGGLESRYTQGVIIFVFARCTVFPLPWRRAIPVPLACAAAYVVALLVATPFSPLLREQWRDRAAVGTLLDNFLFVIAASGVAIFGSHVIAHAQREVQEARRLGNYRLKARIGRGSAGDVWLARQVPLDRDVALKVMRDQPWQGDDALVRFRREALAASRLEHPNTIRIYDFGASDDGVLYIAMELLQGMDLAQTVDMYGAIEPARAVYLARQICGSLGEAHARGILHRDVKPANVFVAQFGHDHDVVKVLDFGVARLVDPGGSVTETGTLFGTPDFMAPEVCGGDKADARSDVYSLGATLYFMLTGTSLFPKASLGEVLMAQITRAPELPSQRVASVPADIEGVVMKCLEKEPEKRWPSVQAVDAALAACADGTAWTKEDSRAWWDAVRAAPRRKVGSGAGYAVP